MKYTYALLRVSLGFVFFWAFIDKLFGFYFTTTPENSWLAGNSPTYGFLKFGTQGPLAETFQSLAGSVWVDYLFMTGLFLIGISLILGIFMRLSVFSGTLMLMLMYLATIPPEHNPVIDDHVIYSLVLLSFLYIHPENYFGLGKWWGSRVSGILK